MDHQLRTHRPLLVLLIGLALVAGACTTDAGPEARTSNSERTGTVSAGDPVARTLPDRTARSAGNGG
ncbi:MAG: hypothetical protein ACOYOP_16745, partial [Microthrixaceae bacterium]